MWTFIKSEVVATGLLVFFSKNEMERNTVIDTNDSATTIANLILQWELEDAAQVTEEVL